MGKNSNIAWTDHTFNPVIGCTKVGPGCDNCYAESQDSRKRWGGVTHWGAGVPRHRTSASTWQQPLTWNRQAERDGKRQRVFCASLADVFDNEWPAGVRTDLFYLIGQTPWLEWLLLTKRIGNAAQMIEDAIFGQKTWPLHWAANNGVVPNVRIMITVVNQDEADRDIPKLFALPYQNGVSYEPALGPIDFHRFLFVGEEGGHEYVGSRRQMLDWAIVGGESSQGKHRARPFDIGAARNTVGQCQDAGVPVFVKQLGSNPQEIAYPSNVTKVEKTQWHSEGWTEIHEQGHRPHWRKYYRLKDRAGADPTEWPADLRVQEFPT